MLEWLTPVETPVPNQLLQAETTLRRRVRLNRYRSRTEVTGEHIIAAFSWLKLPVLTDEGTLESSEPGNVYYSTFSVPRGVPDEQALRDAQDTITGIIAANYSNAFVTFNTASAANGSAAVKQWLDECADYAELPVRPMLTTTPNHKVHVYVNNVTDNKMFVILNNVDTPAFVFKLGAALLTIYQKFGNKTNEIAEKYLTGNGTEVCRVIHEYYAEYESHAQERALLDALNTMTAAICENRERDLINKIEDAQRNIDSLYERIATYTDVLNTHKANYLLFKLTDEDARVQELKTFLHNSYENITGLKAENGTIQIAYKTPLVFFEPDALQRYFDSTRPNVVNEAPNWIQQLLKDIFINKTKQLLIETGAIIYIERPNIGYKNPASIRTDVYAPSEFSGIPNPHHHYYNCWGDNKPNIIRALTEHDYVLAITQVFAAMGGLNLTDTPVMEKFIRSELREYKVTPCIKDVATGEVITIQEYERRYNASTQTN